MVPHEHALKYPANETGFQSWAQVMGRAYRTKEEENHREAVWIRKALFVHRYAPFATQCWSLAGNPLLVPVWRVALPLN